MKGFPETNLPVITKDGKYYSFYLSYQEEPVCLTYNIEGGDNTGTTNPSTPVKSKAIPGSYLTASMNHAPIVFETVLMNEADFNFYSQAIAKRGDEIFGIGMQKNKITFDIDGIYIKDNVIFYSINAKNKSNINYDIDFIKFYIRDKKEHKRTAVQETEVMPIFVYPANQHTILGKSELNRVYCLEKFTIPDRKMLVIEMFEQNGGRVMTMAIKNKAIVNASLLNFARK